MIVSEMELKGVVTFLRRDYHSVCFFFLAHQVEGTIVSNEPEKQTTHWVDIDGIESNEDVPAYHRDFLQHIFTEKKYLYARVEWLEVDDQVTWTIEKSRQEHV